MPPDQPHHGDEAKDEPEIQPGDEAKDEPEIQPCDGGKPDAQPGDEAKDEPEIQPCDSGKPSDECTSTNQQQQNISQQQSYQDTTSQQQAPHMGLQDADSNEHDTCISSTGGLMDAVMDAVMYAVMYAVREVQHRDGGKPSDKSTSTNQPHQGNSRQQSYQDATCSSIPAGFRILRPRGLMDAVTHVDNPVKSYTRQCSISLPFGLGILPYGSKPMADSSPPMDSLIGQFLVEIFDVKANFPFVGTIMVCDRFSSKAICHRENRKQTYKDFSSKRDRWVMSGNGAVGFKDRIQLIGPSRATTADGGFVIKTFIVPAKKKKAIEICKLSCSSDDYNKVKTYTMVTDRGCLYVDCLVLPEALQATVDIELQLPSQWTNVGICGRITAHSLSLTFQAHCLTAMWCSWRCH